MATKNTTRISFRLKTDIFDLVQKLSAETGLDPSAFMQRALELAVYDHLPPERQKELDEETLFSAARRKAREVFDAGRFNEHFILTVFRELMSDAKTRQLYEQVIEADAYTDGAPKKTPLNLNLGKCIKYKIKAQSMLDDAGKPRRAFVKGEPIKSYTLLQSSATCASDLASTAQDV